MTIPRAELLQVAAQANWEESSYRLFFLGENAREECAISGTRWMTEGLEVFDFNKAQVQRALASKRADGATVGSGLPNPVIEAMDIRVHAVFMLGLSGMSGPHSHFATRFHSHKPAQ
jgi:hypothetical protein